MSIDYVKEVLEELKNLKKGVSAKRINKLTEYTLKNIELEDEVTDLIIDYSKEASPSHKVGSLYLVDSLGRAALTNCNDLGLHVLDNNNKPGTLQHIIKKFSDNIKDLLSDCMEKLDDNEEVEKINQLKEVWISEGLFNESLLNNGDSDTDEVDTTPKENEEYEANAPEPFEAPSYEYKDPEVNEPLPRHVYVKAKNGTKMPFINESLSNIERKEEQLRALKEVLFFMNDNPMDLIVTKNLNENNMPEQKEHNQNRHHKVDNHDTVKNRDQMTLIVGEKNEVGSIHYRNKPVMNDATCPLNNVRVMSRTLFIGGISNRDTKRDLTFNILSAQDPHELRVRWALGFGPRAYFNFDTGISTIPLYVVTDAEKEWARNSEWGGTNGKDMVSGMLFEEPDYNPNEVTKINNRRLDFQDHANISNKPLSQRQATELARTNPEILNQRYAQQQQFLYGQQQYQNVSQPQQMYYQNNMYNQQSSNGMYQQGNNNYNQQNNQGMYNQQPSSNQLNNLMNILNQHPQ
ncbi:unnamed protein product [Hanseniaspora opuntiae]